MNIVDRQIQRLFDNLRDFQLRGSIVQQNNIVYDPLTQRYEGDLVTLSVTMIFASNSQRGRDLEATEPNFQRVYVRSTEVIRVSDYILTSTRERWNILSIIRYPAVNVSALDVVRAELEDVDLLSTRLINTDNIAVDDESIDISDEREIGGITIGG